MAEATKTKTRTYVCVAGAVTFKHPSKKNEKGRAEVVRLLHGDSVTVDGKSRHAIAFLVKNSMLVPEEKFKGQRATAKSVYLKVVEEDDNTAKLTPDTVPVPVAGSAVADPSVVPTISEFLSANPDAASGVGEHEQPGGTE